MVKVFLTTAYKENKAPFWLKENALGGKYQIVDDPEIADLVLFVEAHPEDDPYFFSVYQNRLLKKYKNKAVLYHDADLSITFIKTISPSIEKWQFNPRFNRSVHYIARLCENNAINNYTVTDLSIQRTYLYSFIGSRNHPCRETILNRKHSDHVFLMDTTGQKAWELDQLEKEKYENTYLHSIINSDFVLCPRGFGPNTYRLFEVMQMARCPVIISDEWVRPNHIDWDSFAIFIAEKDIDRIEEILVSKKTAATEMGKYAREVWLKYFSPEASFNFLTENALELISNDSEKIYNTKALFQFIRSKYHFRNLLRYFKRTILKL